jgi:hypothetical protein
MKIFDSVVVSSFVVLGAWTAGCGSDAKSSDDDDDGGKGGGAVLGGGAGGTTGGSGGATGGSGGATGGTGGATGGSGGATGGTGGATGGTGGATGGAGGSQAGTTATGGSAGTMATGGSAGAPMGVGDCDEACTKLLAAQCGGTLAVCISNCNQLQTLCATETPAYLSCTLEPASSVTCGTEGPIVTACEAEDREISICLACEPLTTDTECVSCSRTNCCSSIETYLRASDVEAFETCITPCADVACAEACRTASPIASAADEALGECQNDSCAEPCICGARTGDTACLTCAKTNCCAELLPYALASDVAGFSTCLDACADQACADACIADFPVAGPAFQTYSDCALAACPTECG